MSKVHCPKVVSPLLLSLLLVACTQSVASPSPGASSPAPPTPPDDGSVVVTFVVKDERYRILLTDTVDIANARRLLAGDEEAPSIPSGVIVRGESGVNVGYSWHIDPESVEFADMTIEVCDGVPSFVEDGTLEGDRYCPWGARVIDIQPAE